LVVFTTTAIALAVHQTSQIAVRELSATRRGTDPSFWSSLAILNSRRALHPLQQYRRQAVVKGTTSAPSALIVADSCGQELLAKTEVIYAMPFPQREFEQIATTVRPTTTTSTVVATLSFISFFE
jgi:hypothetical protein